MRGTQIILQACRDVRVSPMSAKHNISGSEAERQVAEYLRENEYKIVDINWQTKWCEIDIVAKRDNIIHFVEVKYRKSETYGSGFDYITEAKLKKMRLAAYSWVEINSWSGEYVLSGAEVSGDDLQIQYIPEI